MFKTLTAPPESPVDEDSFRRALRQFASGVTVVTSRDEHARVHGMTATAFCSLSLRPPLVMVAVAKGTRCHHLVTRAGRFGVSILAADQTYLSRHFGGSPRPNAKPIFASLSGVPVLEDAMVKLGCRLEETVRGGDHSIFIGLVTETVTRRGEPLIHFDGQYRSISAAGE